MKRHMTTHEVILLIIATKILAFCLSFPTTNDALTLNTQPFLVACTVVEHPNMACKKLKMCTHDTEYVPVACYFLTVP